MDEVRGRVRDESCAWLATTATVWIGWIVRIHISALLLVEPRRGASDGLEASAGDHLVFESCEDVFTSTSSAPAATSNPRE